MDWLRLFDENQIDYVTRGPNVARGNANIACPFCGDDPSHHMGVSLEKDAWGCWRGMSHKGKKPHGLIRALLNVSFHQAKIIVDNYSHADPESLDDAIKALMYEEPDSATVKRPKLQLRSEFRPVKEKGSSARFWRYLKARGFKDVDAFVDEYDIKCATTGPYADRIIFPIYRRKKLVSWTSRALGNPVNAPRYLALSESDGGLINVFHTLYNWDKLKKGGDTLFIVEGPFDALKLDFYSPWKDVVATCTFGTSMSDEQAMQIAEVSRKFDHSFLLYDEGATEAIFLAKDKLGHTDVNCGFLPSDIEDPGAMSRRQVRAFIKNHI